MKVIRVVAEIGLNLPIGPAKMAYNLTSGLAKRDVSNVVYTLKSTAYARGTETRIYRPMLNFGHYKPSLNMLNDLLKEEGDIVHAHGYRNFQTDAGALLSYLKGIPLVITSHGTIAAPLRTEWSVESRLQVVAYDVATFKFTLRQVSAIVATSEQEVMEIAEFGVPGNVIRLISHGVELPPYSGSPKNQSNFLNLLVVSRLTYKNNIEFAIRGFAEAYKNSHNMRFIIVGDEKPSRYAREELGYKKKLLKLCKEIGVEDKINFTGWLTGEKLWEAYKSADIFLWTSRYDNFGHALVEAAHFGLPIISTPVGVAPEIIDVDEGGILVQQGDMEGLVQAILTLASDATVRRRMGQHNQLKAREYSVERMVNRYIALYQELIS